MTLLLRRMHGQAREDRGLAPPLLVKNSGFHYREGALASPCPRRALRVDLRAPAPEPRAMRRTLGLATLAAIVLGCQPPDATQTWTGTFVTVTSSEGVEPCGGTFDFLDRYAQSVGSYWIGERWSGPPEPFLLELRAGPGEVSGRALSASSAWAGQASSVMHELVHLVTWTEDGVSAPALAEGVAEGLGEGRTADIWLDGFARERPEEFAFLPREAFRPETGTYYAASAQMVAALQRRYGIAAVRAAYQRAPREGPPEDIEAAYVEAFGEGIDETFDEIAAHRERVGIRTRIGTLRSPSYVPQPLVRPSDAQSGPRRARFCPQRPQPWLRRHRPRSLSLVSGLLRRCRSQLFPASFT